jgi:hypothetical protein
MVRKWIIRGLAVALLAVCVVAWVGSYFWCGQSTLARGRHLWVGSILWGTVSLEDLSLGPNSDASAWMVYLRPADHAVSREAYAACDFRFAGFGYRGGWGSGGGAAMVPMWFVTLVAGGGAWWMWRRTRGTGGRGFPVEVGGKEAGG